MKINNTPLEASECYTLVEYLNLKKIKFTHIPQETFTKSWGVKMKNKRMGVKKGVPDYIICLPKILLFIEMKRVKGSSVSEEQLEWQKELSKYDNVKSFIAYGFDEAKKIIDKYE